MFAEIKEGIIRTKKMIEPLKAVLPEEELRKGLDMSFVWIDDGVKKHLTTEIRIEQEDE